MNCKRHARDSRRQQGQPTAAAGINTAKRTPSTTPRQQKTASKQNGLCNHLILLPVPVCLTTSNPPSADTTTTTTELRRSVCAIPHSPAPARPGRGNPAAAPHALPVRLWRPRASIAATGGLRTTPSWRRPCCVAAQREEVDRPSETAEVGAGLRRPKEKDDQEERARDAAKKEEERCAR
jgi:hypothetical protein